MTSSASPPVVRFAPSPTGLLHVGNIRAALFNWLYVRRLGGTFILRLDDTDRARSRPEFEQAIERDLAWLGLDWDRKEKQSDRLAHYDVARDRLIAVGRLYPCYETPEELEFKRKRLLAQGRPPVYDRAALKLSDEDRRRLESEGRRPHWRFKLVAEEVTWDDMVRGPQHVDEASQSDPVLVRADGSYLYSFTSVVDDIGFGITHVIRGEDHVTNTGAQIQMFRALEGPVPVFAHLPLLVDAAGGGLSKRTGSLSVADLRERGVEALAISALLARLGTADAVEPVISLDTLVASVDFARVGRAAARFSEDELAQLSARTLHLLPYADVKERLAGIDADLGEAFWLAVRGNLATLADAAGWAQVVRGPIAPVLEEPAFLAEAAGLLPADPWDETSWKAWTGAITTATGRKGRQLFHPLRLALTAQEKGPEMAKLLPLIGRGRVEARLNGQAA
ncbi:MAG: glutamate--tRNA ligase [Reyranella sp.]|jgi:glutamyl-tRNA synthetase|uniref:glutamate--tRNA ligase n=2 Tax=Pseudomonadota TaxID=1224 RepID=UPI001AC5B121|nr:glutamate--tRNA ligase [Reyranella sp.]MBN9536983.1 glutamate--tRNA ligase [Alphaproteobacteria bacterium]MBR2816746.1 glutamate--tRNA ligase [Reyranella sp.]